MRFLHLLILPLVLAACAFDPTVRDAFHAELVSPYRLDSGDRLRIIVFGQDDLTNTYTVDQAGNLSMPLIGIVAARGKSTPEIEAEVSDRLLSGFLRNPDISSRSTSIGRSSPWARSMPAASTPLFRA